MTTLRVEETSSRPTPTISVKHTAPHHVIVPGIASGGFAIVLAQARPVSGGVVVTGFGVGCAAAGLLRIHDRVVAVDGRPVPQHATAATVAGMLRAVTGDAVQVDIERTTNYVPSGERAVAPPRPSRPRPPGERWCSRGRLNCPLTGSSVRYTLYRQRSRTGCMLLRVSSLVHGTLQPAVLVVCTCLSFCNDSSGARIYTTA